MGEGNVRTIISQNQRRALAAAYDSIADNLVEKAIKLLTENLVYVIDNKNGKTQFNDAMEAAAQSSGVEEFKLYILYKGVKESTKGMWKNFGPPLISSIDEICNENINIIRNKAKLQDTYYSDKDIKLDLLRRYLGYIMWCGNIVIGGGTLTASKK
jgi:hypothetical protein